MSPRLAAALACACAPAAALAAVAVGAVWGGTWLALGAAAAAAGAAGLDAVLGYDEDYSRAKLAFTLYVVATVAFAVGYDLLMGGPDGAGWDPLQSGLLVLHVWIVTVGAGVVGRLAASLEENAIEGDRVN